MDVLFFKEIYNIALVPSEKELARQSRTTFELGFMDSRNIQRVPTTCNSLSRTCLMRASCVIFMPKTSLT